MCIWGLVVLQIFISKLLTNFNRSFVCTIISENGNAFLFNTLSFTYWTYIIWLLHWASKVLMLNMYKWVWKVTNLCHINWKVSISFSVNVPSNVSWAEFQVLKKCCFTEINPYGQTIVFFKTLIKFLNVLIRLFLSAIMKGTVWCCIDILAAKRACFSEDWVQFPEPPSGGSESHLAAENLMPSLAFSGTCTHIHIWSHIHKVNKWSES